MTLDELYELEKKLKKDIKEKREERRNLHKSSNYLIVDLNINRGLSAPTIISLLTYLGKQLGLRKIVVFGQKSFDEYNPFDEEKIYILNSLKERGFLIYGPVEKIFKPENDNYLVVLKDYEKYFSDLMKFRIDNVLVVGNHPERLPYGIPELIKNNELLHGWKSDLQLKKEYESLVYKLLCVQQEIIDRTTVVIYSSNSSNSSSQSSNDSILSGPTLVRSARILSSSPLWR